MTTDSKNHRLAGPAFAATLSRALEVAGRDHIEKAKRAKASIAELGFNPGNPSVWNTTAAEILDRSTGEALKEISAHAASLAERHWIDREGCISSVRDLLLGMVCQAHGSTYGAGVGAEVLLASTVAAVSAANGILSTYIYMADELDKEA